MARRRTPTDEGWRSRSARAAAATMLALLALGLDPDPLAARDPDTNPGDDPGNVLDRTIDDVALLPAGADGADRLLVLRHADRRADGVRVELLVRRRVWHRVAAVAVSHPPSRAVSSARASSLPPKPWLADLGAGRIAVVAPTGDGRTTVVVVDTRRDGGDRLTLERVRLLDLGVTASGVADPAGDGRPALVLMRAVTVPHGGSCQGSRLVVLDAHDLAPRQAFDIPAARLAGAALGRWDGRPGADLLAHAVRTCPAGPDSPGRRVLLVVNLDQGAVAIERAPAREPGVEPPGVPLVLDVEGDGRDEAFLRLGDRLGLLEPSRAWAFTPVGEPGALGIAAAGRDAGAASVAWLDATADDAPGIRFGRVERDSGRVRVTTVGALDGTAIDPDWWAGMVAEARGAALAGASPATWRADLDVDGCPELVAPLVLAECDGHGPVRAGPAWLGTRPVALVGPADRRRLLVAASLDWRIGRATLGTPVIEAADPGAWRTGGSGPFALAELPVEDLARVRTFPAPRPTVATTAGGDRTITVSAVTGVRIFARVEDASGGRPTARPSPDDLGALLGDPGTTRESRRIVRLPVPPGAAAGRQTSAIPIALDPAAGPGGAAPTDWHVTLVAVSDWGEPSEPIEVTVDRDLAGPAVVLDPPLVSAPWPFETTVQGTTEARTTLRLSDGRIVTADRRGRFELPVRLAPWPQRLRIRAVDPFGNSTDLEVEVMGGVDVPRLPWEWLLGVGLIGAVATSAIRTGRVRPAAVRPPSPAPSTTRPRVPAATVSPPDRGRQGSLGGTERGESGIEIEEVPPGSGVPRG